jgi:hypothetical protein
MERNRVNVYQKINEVMKKVSYVKKDTQVQNYKAVSHDQVVSIVRQHFIDVGIVVHVEQFHSEILVQKDEHNKMHLYSGDYIVNFVNIENPEDKIPMRINAHAADNGDKAPGKCVSYATKTAILKLLSLETGENDESRAEVEQGFTDIQKNEFYELIERNDALGFAAFIRYVGQDVETKLYKTFPIGRITELKETCRKLQAKGFENAQNTADEIMKLSKNEDPAVSEIVDELTHQEKQLIATMLDQKTIEHLRSIK